MTTAPSRRRSTVAAIALLTATLVPGLASLPALADDTASVPGRSADPATLAQQKVPDLSTTFAGISDPVPGLRDVDVRGTALPSALQQRAAARLGDVDLRWNRFGTPASILPADGVLARVPAGNPVTAARTWLRDNADLFGITRAQVDGMEAIDQPLVQSDAHAVFFRQRFGGLLPAIGSAVTVGVRRGEIAYVSSSITKTTEQPPTATITPAAGWLKAAADVGLDLPADINRITRTVRDGWTRLVVPGVVQEQQVRLRALANADGSVRPVLEANVVDVGDLGTSAYTVLVDGVSGEVLHRQNKVLNHSDLTSSPSTVVTPASAGTLARSESQTPFAGAITAGACGPEHEFRITDGKTRGITVVVAAVNTANDITINLYDPSGKLVAAQDLLTSPEVLSYSSADIPAGTWTTEVCPFESPDVPALPPFNYVGYVSTSDASGGGGGGGGLGAAYNPKWRFFAANPTLDSSRQVPRNAVVGCWIERAGCTLKSGQLNNVAAFAPWDVLTNTGTSTLTTAGNNALTREAWVSPLTPGGLLQAPVSLNGDYRLPFTDAWNNSRCNPAELTPGGNDILFSTANLFVTHNRMHDYSYYLGLTEKNYNAQLDNGGRGGLEGDPEIGNVQAGALGGVQTGLGRDNANQIALQDGIPGITNQYLFQPLAGAFYSPCTDGGLDMGIVGHEYTHLTSNRMVGGPDEGLNSTHGGSMGESWSDLVAAEFQFSHGYSNGGNVWAVGAYATGNKTVAIRDYAINRNPLNFSNFGFDSTGPEVHSDGEIWNATQWEVRSALVKRWNKRYPYSDKKLQLRCAQAGPVKGVEPPYKCPGNRRWVQLMFDSFLLQQGATSMLDARDAMIAADRLRFGGVNRTVLWDAFARRGMGVGARTRDGEVVAPKPSFKSIGGNRRNTKVVFRTPGTGKIYVGDYEQRSRAIADTARSNKKLASFAYFTPGRYDMLYVGTHYGHMRFHLTVRPGKRVQVNRIRTTKNLAASRNGGRIIRTTGGQSRTPQALIDGSEVNGWGVLSTGNVDATKPTIAVDLAGKKPVTVRTVSVSASLRPAYQKDDTAGSRFTALRKFAVEACLRACSSPSATWRRFYVSPGNAFPSTRPRPVAPTLNMRAFRTKPTRARALRLVVLENQCTGFAGYAGELDADPLNDTDCKTASDRGTIAHVTDLQVFNRNFPSWRSSYGIDSPQRSYGLKRR